MVDILKRSAATILHTDPELVSPQVRAKVLYDVDVSAVLHHDDLLLDDTEVVPWRCSRTPVSTEGSCTISWPLSNIEPFALRSQDEQMAAGGTDRCRFQTALVNAAGSRGT